MKPIDLRNATWSSIQTDLQGRLRLAYTIWQTLGPGTTRQVAAQADWDILSFRPRTTDLYHLGLVELVDRVEAEGVYRARSQADWEAWSATQQTPVIEHQQNLI